MRMQIVNLNKSYGTKDILHDINLELPAGQIVGLLGPNGAGKSTLIKCINDLLEFSGDVLIDEKPFTAQDHAKIAYLPEKTYLDPQSTARRTLRFFKSFYPDFDEEKALKLIEKMELDPDQRIKTMSKGMQEKLQLILVLCRNAELYIFDEPIGGVDPAAREKILDLILDNFNENATYLISTHMISEIERILERAIVLRHGRIVMDENVEDIRLRTGKSLQTVFVEALL